MALKIELLQDSIRNQDHSTFTRLLKQFTGDELNEVDENGMTALHTACFENNPQAVSQLLNIKNINVNVIHAKTLQTPFITAICRSSVQCVELMVENEKVDIFVFIGVLEALTQIKGTDKRTQHILTYIRKKRAERIQLGTVPVLTQLMEYMDTKDDLNFNRILKNIDGEQLNKIYQFGFPPVTLACITNNHKALEKFLKVPNIDLEFRNVVGFTPYVMAFANTSTECMELLLQDLRVDIFPQRFPSNVSGSEMEKRNVVKLVEKEKRRRIKIGKASLVQQLNDSIRSFDSAETTKLLAQMTCDQVNEVQPFFKDTPLHLACHTNNSKAVTQLLKFENIALDAQNTYGFVPLLLAIRACSLESIEVLMDDRRIEIDSMEDVLKLIGNLGKPDGIPSSEQSTAESLLLIQNIFDKREKLNKMRSKRNQNKKNCEQERITPVEISAQSIGGKELEEVLEFIEGPNKSTNKTKKKQEKKKLKSNKNNTFAQNLHFTCDDTISYPAEKISERNNNEYKSMIEEFKWSKIGELQFSEQNVIGSGDPYYINLLRDCKRAMEYEV